MKPVILVFVKYYLPGYKSGGPVRSITNLVSHLRERFGFRIVTLDRDLFDRQPYPGIRINNWNEVEGTQIFYASPSFMRFGNIVRLLRNTTHHVLYLNSFFDPRFTMLALLGRRLAIVPSTPVILAPRGEFCAGAISLKVWKKRSFVALTPFIGLYRNIIWHASSKYEADDIRRGLGRAASRIEVAANLSTSTPPNVRNVESDDQLVRGPLRLVFLSRISRKKNLDFALRVLAEVEAPILLNIYGVVFEQDYWIHCKSQIDALPAHVTVRYHGAIAHHRVAKVLASHDLFFLPTRGENYGHVIHEALAAGTPVLISDQTPWRDLDHAEVGWVRALDEIGDFVEIIERFAQLGGTERQRLRARASAYAGRASTARDALEKNISLFTDVLRECQTESLS